MLISAGVAKTELFRNDSQTPRLDRSQSLFYFVPQEKVILTVKLARLGQAPQNRNERMECVFVNEE